MESFVTASLISNLEWGGTGYRLVAGCSDGDRVQCGLQLGCTRRLIRDDSFEEGRDQGALVRRLCREMGGLDGRHLATRLDGIARRHQARSGIVKNEGLARTEYAYNVLVPVHTSEIRRDPANHAGRERHGRGDKVVIAKVRVTGADTVAGGVDR